ncbi:hypothetical protein DPMN_119132 [Dreissena polymorpha]|uniref:Uncharacterized protein n=1 Tax=Dreissena polymorpha TaxID=45954 RepID=A0A9D4JQZ1_DREPO|nr:hypothetical protein DPMN_119132 [Dreissena polymorpha]
MLRDPTTITASATSLPDVRNSVLTELSFVRDGIPTSEVNTGAVPRLLVGGGGILKDLLGNQGAARARGGC